MYARIENGLVAEIVPAITAKVPDKVTKTVKGKKVTEEVEVEKPLFHESLVFVECPEGTEVGMVYEGGKFKAAPEPEITIEDVRARRNHLLRESDWTQLMDAPLTDAARTKWAAYRQELRDLPEDFNPKAVAWPKAPA